ncbi:MAG: sulfotransferase [Flavobacteriales bacterium]|nr:sulfotransferase [Flavobacteriales bacterium]
MSKVKEPMFFNNFKQKNNYFVRGRKTKKITTLQEYKTLFNDVKDEKAIGEASPGYIYNLSAPILIKEEIPNVKIIAILRQPVSRAYSNFLHSKRANREPIEKFEDALNEEENRIKKNWSPLYHYKEKGFYFQQLKRYFGLFPKENIKILLFDEVVKNPKKACKDIFKFLQVDDSFIPNTSKKTNVSGTPKGLFGWLIMKLRFYNLLPNIQFSKYLPNFLLKLIFNAAYSKPEKLDESLKKELTKKYYKEEILELEKLIEKDLSHWL